MSSWTIAGRNRLGGHSGVGSEGEMISVCAGFDDGGEDLTWEPALPVTPTGGGFQVVSDCGDLHGRGPCTDVAGVRKGSERSRAARLHCSGPTSAMPWIRASAPCCVAAATASRHTLAHESMWHRLRNDYLEQKKKYFPRFYFVANGALLDILSNGNKPLKAGEMQSCLRTIN